MKTTIRSNFATLAIVGIATFDMTANESRGELVVYEPFNYSNVGGDLNGQSGAGSFGFSNAWSGNTSFNINNGSIAPPVSPFDTSGNAMTTVAFDGNREVVRSLSSTFGDANTTRYISFLMRPEGILHQGAFAGWFGLHLRGTRDVNVVMSSFGDKYHLEVGLTTSQTNTNAVVGTPVLFVMRMDFTEGVDNVRLYLNPQPSDPEPTIADASQINFNIENISLVSLTGPGAFSFDELRIGTTYADVLPYSSTVPEPSTAILAATTALALIPRMRRSPRKWN